MLYISPKGAITAFFCTDECAGFIGNSGSFGSVLAGSVLSPARVGYLLVHISDLIGAVERTLQCFPLGYSVAFRAQPLRRYPSRCRSSYLSAAEPLLIIILRSTVFSRLTGKSVVPINSVRSERLFSYVFYPIVADNCSVRRPVESRIDSSCI